MLLVPKALSSAPAGVAFDTLIVRLKARET